MPRFHHNITVCGHSDAKCVDTVREEIQADENDEICQNGCHAINYEMALSSTPILEQAPILKKMGIVGKNAGILHVYYQNSYYRSQNKEQFTGLTEFLCKHSPLYSYSYSILIIFIRKSNNELFASFTI